jgi:hypothetical protein
VGPGRRARPQAPRAELAPGKTRRTTAKWWSQALSGVAAAG